MNKREMFPPGTAVIVLGFVEPLDATCERLIGKDDGPPAYVFGGHVRGDAPFEDALFIGNGEGGLFFDGTPVEPPSALLAKTLPSMAMIVRPEEEPDQTGIRTYVLMRVTPADVATTDGNTLFATFDRLFRKKLRHVMYSSN